MSEISGIEWIKGPDGRPGSTWNPLRGTEGNWTCVKATEECIRCYAEAQNLRWSGIPYGDIGVKEPPDKLRLDEHTLHEPIRWARTHSATGRPLKHGGPRPIFPGSMTDLFGQWVPEEWIERIFEVCDRAPEHWYLFLTKRPEVMVRMATRRAARRAIGESRVPPWEWYGVSVGMQSVIWKGYMLMDLPADVRWLSMEPLIGPVDVRPLLAQTAPDGRPAINWVVVGGESGHGYRAMNPEWARAIRDACQEYQVPFFFKQWGGPTHSAGGRLLDGRTWDETPVREPHAMEPKLALV